MPNLSLLELDRLNTQFFEKPTVQVAEDLLGKVLVRVHKNQLMAGKIVETEAYSFGDPASHCCQKKTARNQALFGPVGHAYVYTSYGMHYGFNVVAFAKNSQAGGVLIRALEPILGVKHMQNNRSKTGFLLTNGPGKLTEALLIDNSFYGYDLKHGQELFLAKLKQKKEDFIIKKTPRIGISKAQEYLWRFIISNNPWVTPHKFNKYS
jgi:DNA-3-methyladenine glycosylase